MHAVVIKVTVKDRDGARERLESEVVPRTASSPGFVAGYWLDDGDENKGQAVVVFDSEEHARAMAERVEAPGGEVTFDSVDVREVVAHA